MIVVPVLATIRSCLKGRNEAGLASLDHNRNKEQTSFVKSRLHPTNIFTLLHNFWIETTNQQSAVVANGYLSYTVFVLTGTCTYLEGKCTASWPSGSYHQQHVGHSNNRVH